VQTPSPLARTWEALVFSGAWVSLAATALAAAASAVFGRPAEPALLVLVFCGTFSVYGIDRLRDLERDRTTAPLRSAFVSAHRRGLAAAVAAAIAVAGVLAVGEGRRILVIAAGVGGIGLLHRRLKRVAFAKAGYVAAAWVLVTVALPAVRSGATPDLAAWVAGALGAALLANAIASNVRDREAAAARVGAARALALARGTAAFGVAAALLAPAPARPLALVPLVTLLALLGFRRDERYGLVVVDGALTAGALLALALIGAD